MNQITFDKLAYVHGLRSGGFSEQQAEAAAQALDGALRGSVASQTDVQASTRELDSKIDTTRRELEAKIDSVKHELEAKIDGVKHELEAKIDGVKHELEAKIDGVKHELEAKIESQKTELIKWFVPLMLGQTAVTVTLVVALTKLL